MMATRDTSAFIGVLDLTDGFPADLPLEQRDETVRRAMLRAIRVDVGRIDPADLLDGAVGVRGPVSGLVLAEGMMLAHITMAGRTATQLLGPGDLLATSAQDALLPYVRRYQVVEQVAIAVLDDRFRAITQRWPWIASRILQNSADQQERSAVYEAILQLSRVEVRILAFMWHVAERWGRVTPDGLMVGVPFTHEALGCLVGAKRPTVSLALKELASDGLLRRRPDRTWLVHPDSAEMLGSPADARRAQKTAAASANGGSGQLTWMPVRAYADLHVRRKSGSG
jgi:CRP/FNR family transcriptional regulator, cyclic AMP receptor protein